MDYWDFPAIHGAFFDTFPGTRRVCSRGGVYRLRGKTLTMVLPPDGWIFDHLRGEFQFEKFRSFLRTDVPDAVPRYKSGKTWYVEPGFTPSRAAGQEWRRGQREGVVVATPDGEELAMLLAEWKVWAAQRHFMVVTGHYKSMILRSDMQYVGLYLQGKLIGAIGHTVQSNLACIGFCKSVPGYWWLGKALWVAALTHILGPSTGVSRIICGDTADKLKKAIGMTSVPVYRLKGDVVCPLI